MYIVGRLLKWPLRVSLTRGHPLYHPCPLRVCGIGEYDGNMIMLDGKKNFAVIKVDLELIKMEII